MPTSLVPSLVSTPPRHPLATPAIGLGDPEGGCESPAGVGRKQGPSSAPTPSVFPHTLSVSHTVTIPIALSRGLNAREHPLARCRRVKRERLATSWALTAAHVPHALTPCTVTLTRLSRGTLDSDNLQGAFKAVRDEIAAYLGTNDGPKGGIEWVYGQGYGARHAISIDIEAAQ